MYDKPNAHQTHDKTSQSATSSEIEVKNQSENSGSNQNSQQRFNPSNLTPANILRLQKTIGNQAVQRLIERSKEGTIQRAVHTFDYYHPNGATKKRPSKAGKVIITTEDFTNRDGKEGERPTNVNGIIVLTKTSGRSGAPPSITGFSSVGTPDVQRGHLMALELGGPDVDYNIVPQFAQWQANGEWRKQESEIAERAQGKKDVVYNVDVTYGRDPRFPKSFTVSAIGTNVKYGPETKVQGQDKTDDKMMFRQDDLAHRKRKQPSPYSLEDLGGKRIKLDKYPEVKDKKVKPSTDIESDEESDEEMMESPYPDGATISNTKFSKYDESDDEDYEPY